MKEYIGDGVYVDYDGWQIALTTERENGTNIIYLEPLLWLNLKKYVERLKTRS